MNPKVTIAIPTYNRAEMLVRAVKSALNQSYHNIEVVVSDNGSSYDVAELLSPYAGVVIRIANCNVGIVRNWNACVEISSGDYVCILSDDDELLPTAIEDIMSYEPHVDAAIRYGLIVDQKREGPSRVEPGADFVLNYLAGRRTAFPSAALIKREDLIRAGGYPDIKNSLDVGLLLAVANGASNVCFIDSIVCDYNRHDTNLTLSNSTFDAYFALEAFLISKMPDKKLPILLFTRKSAMFWLLSALRRRDLSAVIYGVSYLFKGVLSR